MWRHPETGAADYNDLDYWTELAQHAGARPLRRHLHRRRARHLRRLRRRPRGGAARRALQVPVNDPLLVVPAMAAVTEHLGFGITALDLVTSTRTPFARRMSTLDHLTKGRVGWNIVTSYLRQRRPQHRPRRPGPRTTSATTSPTSTSRSSTSSGRARWEDDAVVRDRERGVFTDPGKVHRDRPRRRATSGSPGIHLSEPSPQRTPVLYQAGAVRPRADLRRRARRGGLHGRADRPRSCAANVADLRGARRRRRPRRRPTSRSSSATRWSSPPSEAEAEEKHADYRSLIDPEGTLALWSGWLGFDLSPYELDEPLGTCRTRRCSRPTRTSATAEWTVRDLVEGLRLGADGPTAVGCAGAGRRPDRGLDRRDRRRRAQPQLRRHARHLRRLRRARRPRAAAPRPLPHLLRRGHPAREVLRPRLAAARDPPGGVPPPEPARRAGSRRGRGLKARQNERPTDPAGGHPEDLLEPGSPRLGGVAGGDRRRRRRARARPGPPLRADPVDQGLAARRPPRAASDGGAGRPVRDLFRILVALGAADSNVAHILRQHFAYVEQSLRSTVEGQRERWLRRPRRGRSSAAPRPNSAAPRSGPNRSRPISPGSTASCGSAAPSTTRTGSLYSDWLIDRRARRRRRAGRS